jgi:hypothetical protein
MMVPAPVRRVEEAHVYVHGFSSARKGLPGGFGHVGPRSPFAELNMMHIFTWVLIRPEGRRLQNRIRELQVASVSFERGAESLHYETVEANLRKAIINDPTPFTPSPFRCSQPNHHGVLQMGSRPRLHEPRPRSSRRHHQQQRQRQQRWQQQQRS